MTPTLLIVDDEKTQREGLRAALDWFIEGVTKRSKIQIALTIRPQDFPRLSGEIETAIFRVLQEELTMHEDHRVRAAIDVFCYRARKYVGAYMTGMGGADALIFTGGIGENSAPIRAQICNGLEWTGLRLDEGHALGRWSGHPPSGQLALTATACQRLGPP